ncbi:hypothetical protein TNCV_4689221 [Trichonephila clavipes]|nr:hypothetical protein TNCV_4689221 [Trichonephila clavipes]
MARDSWPASRVQLLVPLKLNFLLKLKVLPLEWRGSLERVYQCRSQPSYLTFDKESHRVAVEYQYKRKDLIKSFELLYVFHNDECCKEPLPAPGNRSNERRYKEKDLARTEEKRSEWEKESGGKENRVYLQVDDHVHPGNCPAAVSSKKNNKKTRPSSYGVLPSPAELGYERTDVVFFFIF